MEPRFTPNQTRALLSLQPDGTLARAPRGLHRVCVCLSELWPEGVQKIPGFVGDNGGLTYLFRLTEEGRAARARIATDRAP